MAVTSTIYQVFNTLTGLHEEATTYEEALALRSQIALALLNRDIGAFTIAQVDKNDDGTETWSAVDLNHLDFAVSTVNKPVVNGGE